MAHQPLLASCEESEKEESHQRDGTSSSPSFHTRTSSEIGAPSRLCHVPFYLSRRTRHLLIGCLILSLIGLFSLTLLSETSQDWLRNSKWTSTLSKFNHFYPDHHPHPLIVIRSGCRLDNGLGDYLKNIAATMLLAKLLGGQARITPSLSSHGYDGLDFMPNLNLMGTTIESGRICLTQELYEPHREKEDFLSYCMSGNLSFVLDIQQKAKRLNCQTVILNEEAWIERDDLYPCLVDEIRAVIDIKPIEDLWESPHTDEDTVRIAVHYRWGDLEGDMEKLDWSKAYRRITLTDVKKSLEASIKLAKKADILIFAENFQQDHLPGLGDTLRNHQIVNTSNIRLSLGSMMTADILIGGGSGFADIARLITFAKCIVMPNNLFIQEYPGKRASFLATKLETFILDPFSCYPSPFI